MTKNPTLIRLFIHNFVSIARSKLNTTPDLQYLSIHSRSDDMFKNVEFQDIEVLVEDRFPFGMWLTFVYFLGWLIDIRYNALTFNRRTEKTQTGSVKGHKWCI